MRTAAIAAMMAFTGSAALACSAVENDAERLACYDARYTEVSLIRCTARGSHASCDLLTPSPDTLMSCVVFNAAGEPIARDAATGSSGLPLRDIAVDEIASVDCEIIG